MADTGLDGHFNHYDTDTRDVVNDGYETFPFLVIVE